MSTELTYNGYSFSSCWIITADEECDICHRCAMTLRHSTTTNVRHSHDCPDHVAESHRHPQAKLKGG
jgi:hypothetical protein